MPTNSEITIRGGYNPFTLKRDHHLDIFANAVEKITQQHEKALEQQAAIKTALANVKLNEAEDKWKQNYIEDISKQIDNASRFGNYSTALSTATKLAGDAVSNPALLGRVRYNENREKWLANLESRRARGEIDSETYARAEAENAYDYKDVYNESGTKVVGGTDWKAAFNPVNDINLDQVREQIKAMVTPSSKASSSKGGTSQVYLDKEGKQTTDINQARGVFATKTGGGSGYSETGVTAQEWANAYDAWLNEHPEAAQAFEQKRQNSIWRYKQYLIQSTNENLSEEERATAKANADIQYKYITDDSGALLTAENYARSIANPMFKVMQYKRTSSSSEGGSTLFNEQIGHNKLQGEILGLSFGQAEIYSNSSPLEKIAILKSVATTTSGLNEAGQKELDMLQASFRGSTWGGN